jgi:predicted MFS family arabinose efflux permease
VQQFRFAAMESVSSDEMANAVAKVLLGGLVAAFIGPELALYNKDLFKVEFVGSFLSLAVLYLLSLLLLTLYQQKQSTKIQASTAGRPLKLIIKQPVFWAAVLSATIGYALMSFIMTATPMSMHIHDGHNLSDTKWVIQSHIMAMFLPSLFSGYLINKFGVKRIMLTGVGIFIACILIALLDRSLLIYWLSLVLLGVGWNFLFVSGTALLPHCYHENERFKVQAVNEGCVFSVQALASLSSGWVLFQFGWENLLWLSLPMLSIVLIAIYYWQKSSFKEIVV